MNKLFKIYMTGLAVAAAVATSGVVLFSGKEPVIKEKPTSECYELATPARDEFKFQCESRNRNYTIDDSVLQGIEAVRVKTSTTHGCNPNLEKWSCVKDTFGRYRAILQ